MSPRIADPEVRRRLVSTAARLIAEEGPASLTLRRLSREVGTSTMAVYTHLGSMDRVRWEVRREGFARFGRVLGEVDVTDDPVADLSVIGWAYMTSAVAEPHMYRAMFLEGPAGEGDEDTGEETFAVLVDAVRRSMVAGRLRVEGDLDDEAVAVATEIWALAHGLVTLQFAGMLTPEVASDRLVTGVSRLLKALGDEPDALERSYGAALERMVRIEASDPTR